MSDCSKVRSETSHLVSKHSLLTQRRPPTPPLPPLVQHPTGLHQHPRRGNVTSVRCPHQGRPAPPVLVAEPGLIFDQRGDGARVSVECCNHRQREISQRLATGEEHGMEWGLAREVIIRGGRDGRETQAPRHSGLVWGMLSRVCCLGPRAPA